jgi:hypothetical protein
MTRRHPFVHPFPSNNTRAAGFHHFPDQRFSGNFVAQQVKNRELGLELTRVPLKALPAVNTIARGINSESVRPAYSLDELENG